MAALTPRQRQLLAAIAAATRPSNSAQLAQHLDVRPDTIQRLACALVRHGLVYELHYTDLSVEYEVSPAGRAALAHDPHDRH